MMRFIIILLISLSFPNKIAKADSAADRCSVPHCTCKVLPGPPPKDKTTYLTSSRRDAVLFEHDSYIISEYKKEKIISTHDYIFDDLNIDLDSSNP